MANLIDNAIKFAEADFWESNPQLKYMTPFKDIYEWKGKSQEWTSRVGWSIFLFCDPNSKFTRMSKENRKDEIEKHFMKEKIFHLAKVKECVKLYPERLLTPAKRNFKGWEDLLTKRDKFLKDKDYSPETYQMLDSMMKDSKTIWERFLSIKAEMEAEDAKANTRGGMKKSAAEKGELFNN